MNLENLNLVELSAQEVGNTRGGNGVHSGGYGLVSNRDLANGMGEFLHAAGDFFRGFFIG